MSTRGDLIDELRAADPAQGMPDGPLDGRASSDLQRAIARPAERPRNESATHGSRWRVPVIAATATLVAVAGVPLVKALDGSDPAPQGTPTGVTNAAAGPWTYSFTVDYPAGWRLYNRNVERDLQVTSVIGPEQQACDIVEFRKGTFDAGRLIAPKTVRVNDHSGFVAGLRDLKLPVFKGLGARDYVRPTGSVVAWEHAPDSWRLAHCVPGKPGASEDPADALRVARAVKNAPRAVRTPFRTGYLPGGWKARTVGEPGSQFKAPNTALAMSTFVPADKSDTEPLSSSPDSRTFQHIAVSLPTHVVTTGATPLKVGGRSAWLAQETPPGVGLTTYWLVIRYDGFWVQVEATTKGPFDKEVVRIAEGLTLASRPLDPATWFDANSAVPR